MLSSSERETVKSVWVLCWEEMEKCVGHSSFVSFLNNLEGEK